MTIKTLKELRNKYIFIDMMSITDEVEFINITFNMDGNPSYSMIFARYEVHNAF